MSRAAKPVTKAQRTLITDHLSDPRMVTQRDVMTRLRIKNYNTFYQLVYKVVRTNQ